MSMDLDVDYRPVIGLAGALLYVFGRETVASRHSRMAEAEHHHVLCCRRSLEEDRRDQGNGVGS
jgi:hypothetical protein